MRFIMILDKSKPMSTRDGFGKALVALGEIDKNVVVLSADLTESVRAHWFKEKYPDRFISHGVSEQDMIGTSAGMALAGKVPFACTFGAFAAGRAWDQIRVSVAYMNLNVNIAGTHGGISVGGDGATHQALEEITLMRILPHMTVVVPADAEEAYLATIQASKLSGPVYLRLGRAGAEFLKQPGEFQIGKARVITEGNDISIIACGHMVIKALSAAKRLESRGIFARVINLHTVKPLDEEVIIKAARETKRVLTIEEHSIYGGMGSAVAEVLVEKCPVPMKLMGIKNQFGISGNPDDLYKYFGLTEDNIVIEAEKLLLL
ncbi:transketolase, pyridine binding domain protein [Candidatus Omnitrophus magneticus]|uniref:Transketolase, pyridine binding domain protein n=1 Tax=Candidatus Omnitrophus magneticus TaxID=1609969 RepID=A0A0F0CQ89_9BACT|nr:transketolase, pyridine binding domain protein [Candidatus Omnitrophus magneticus]